MVTEAAQFNARQKPVRVLNPFFSLQGGSLDNLLAFENIEVPGWSRRHPAIAGLLAAVLIGAATGLLLLATRRIHLRQGFAHGPAMLLGALIVFTFASLPQS